MNRLTRNGTSEPVSRDQILRRELRRGKAHIFPVQLATSRIGNDTRLIHTLLKVLAIHIYIHYYYQSAATYFLMPESGHLRSGPRCTAVCWRGVPSLAIPNQFCPTTSIKVSTTKVPRFLKCGGINHGLVHPRVETPPALLCGNPA